MRPNLNTGLLILFAVSLSVLIMCGCSAEQVIQRTIDTVIHYDTVYVPVPADSSLLTLDSSNTAEDVKYIVKVDTVLRTVFVKGKPRTIRVLQIDTVTVTKTETKIEKSDDLTFREMFTWASALLGLVLLIVLIKK